MAGQSFAQEASHRRRYLEGEGAIVRGGEMLDGDLEPSALRAQNGAGEKIGDGLRFKGGRHHHQRELGPFLLQSVQQSERDIAVEMPLVKLVEEHGRHTA